IQLFRIARDTASLKILYVIVVLTPDFGQTYVRYAVRQKRAEIKKVLKDYLLYGKPSKQNCQDDIYGYDDTSISRNLRKAKFHSSSSYGKCCHGRKRSELLLIIFWDSHLLSEFQ
ncbi:hypothetical protein BHE74_00034796, partial [Ensete ventricosum]